MRLIDADKIDFGEVFIGASSDFAKDTREAAQNLIDAQPTAYDVDKVVERLGELKEIYPICGGMLHVYAVRIDKAINAVKEGFGILTMAAGQEGGSDDKRNP